MNRIAQVSETQTGYFLPYALGSVRQIADEDGELVLNQRYEAYGEVLSSQGTGESRYGFTGEWQQDGLVYLRARYYAPGQGRFLSRDIWEGDANVPVSYNAWLYGYANPIVNLDPTGLWTCDGHKDCTLWVNNALQELEKSGDTGKKLVDYFKKYDDIVKGLNQAYIDWQYQKGKEQCSQVVVGEAEGLRITFTKYTLPPSEANTFYPRVLQIDIKSINQGLTPDHYWTSIFGHEISHYKQGGDRFSMQGEMFAQFTGAQIWLDLGNTDLEQYPHYITVELVTGKIAANQNLPYPYNPFTTAGLKASQAYYVKEVWWGYSLLPLSGKRFSEQWLQELSVDWYKTEQWYMDYVNPTRLIK